MSNLKGFLSKAKALSRSTLSVVLVLCLLMLMIPTVLLVAADDVWNGTTTDPYSGAGTEASPFIIETGAQLAYMAERVNNGQDTYGHFQLAADIDLNDKNWTPIGNTGTTSRFMGTFDGKDHTITGLYISVTEHYQGLFGAAQNATIKNLKIKDADITAYSNVGGIVGATWATVNITNCSFSGAIDATVGAANTADDIATGGLVGGVKGGTTTIDGCTVEAGTTITSHQGATLGWAYSGTGGLVGSASSSSALNVVIRNSSSAANITTLNKTTGAGGNGTGGIMGVVRSTGGTSTVKVTMTNTYSTGAISGGGVRGGLLGFMRTTGATATGKVEAEIKDCYSTVSGLNSGLIGKNYNSSDNLSKVTVSIKNSYFAGQATNPIFITDSNNGTINLTMDRVYYLAGSATAANMFTPEKNGATISISNVSETASLTDGTLVAALNNGRNVWYQGVNGPILPKAPKITNLEVGDGLINFSAEVTEYNVFLDNTVTSLTVKPTVEAGTTVTVAGEAVTSGTAKTVDLTANDTTVIEVKISRDGTDKIYTVSVTCAALWDGVSAEPYPNADEADAGTKENPYQIGLPSHLAYMAQQINLGNDRTAYYELVANIALADKQWTPIGGKIDGTNRTFGGTFNGNGYSITGLNYTYDITTDADNDGVTDAVDTYNAASAPGRSSGGVGLFGLVAGATIKNVTVQGSVVTDQYLAGGLIGGANGSVTLKNCHFNGTVRSGSQSYTSYAGGLIAQAATAGSTITITDCSFNGSVTADQTKWYTYTSASDTTLKLNTQTPEAVGGFIGYLSNGAVAFIADSYVNAVITANGGNGIGGMIGSVQYGSSMTTATIERCYTSGSVTGNSGTGGIVGWVRDNSTTADGKGAKLIMKNCYSDATVSPSGTGTSHSGLVAGARFDCSDEDLIICLENCFYAGSGAGRPIAYHNPTGSTYALSRWDIDVTKAGYTPVSYTNNVYYLEGSFTAAISGDITNGMTEAVKTADEMKAQAFVDLLNANAGDDVWALGTDHPVLKGFPKLDNIKLSQGSIEFNPLVYNYQTYISNIYNSVTVTPVTDDSSITIKVNGNDVVSGEASPAVALAATGTTDIKVDVTRNGSTKTYTIQITLTEGWDGLSALPFPNIDEANAGTAENPYVISQPEHLAFLRLLANSTDVNKNTETGFTTTTIVYNDVTYTVTYKNSYLGNLYNAHFKLTADINLNNKDWAPFDFRGRLDGAGHTVTGLSALKDSTTGNVGLFASVTYGSVSNLNVVGNVSGGSDVGGIAGRLQGGAKLTNCSFTGTVSGANHVGGLTGYTVPYDGTGAIFNVTACWTSGTVTGTGNGIGGLVGYSGTHATYGGVVNLTDCYSTMTVSKTTANVDNMAGLAGSGNFVIRNCFFAGHIDSAYPIGFSKVDTVGSAHYKEGSCNDVTSANAGFVGGTKVSAADINGSDFVKLLNQYASAGVVWSTGLDHAVFTYTDPGEVEATPDPFYLTGLASEHVAFTFTPNKFSYSFTYPYSAEKIHLLPSAPAGATITVDGQTVVSGEFSQAIALEVGVEKTVIIKVSVGNSYTNYELKLLRREQPANGVWDGALEPFDDKQNKGSKIDNPILIETPGQLAFLSAMVNGKDVLLDGKVYTAPSAIGGEVYRDKYFEITADLIMNDVTDYANWATAKPMNNFDPIGHFSDTAELSRAFAGIMNGNSHKIVGLYINTKEYGGSAGVGLFGSVQNGTLRNIHVENGYVVSSMRVGGIVGRPRNYIELENCSYSGTVRGTYVSKTASTLVGGLIGDCVAKAFVNSCWTEGTVISGRGSGGLVGQIYIMTGFEMKNSYSAMTIETPDDYDEYIGGLVGVVSGQAGTVEFYRSHFAGHVSTDDPFIGGFSETCGGAVAASDTVYFRADSYEGELDTEFTYDAVEKSVDEFADGTVTKLLNDLVDVGDFWYWEDGDNGYPVSDGVLLITDFRDHTSDEFFDDGDWYKVFENKPGGTLKNPGSNNNKGDSDDGEYNDDYTNSDTGENSLFSAVLILALISAGFVVFLARRKRSTN